MPSLILDKGKRQRRVFDITAAEGHDIVGLIGHVERSRAVVKQLVVPICQPDPALLVVIHSGSELRLYLRQLRKVELVGLKLDFRFVIRRRS